MITQEKKENLLIYLKAKQDPALGVLQAIQKLKKDFEEKIKDLEEKLSSIKEGKVGERGPRGERGLSGKDGKMGADGKDGRDGIDGKNGLNGKDGLNGQDGLMGLSGLNGKDGSPDTADDIRNKLELLPDGEKLKIDAIEDLRKEIDGLKKIETKVIGGSRKITYTKSYNLTSQVNGSTSAFTLPKDTVRVLGVFGTQFPINFNADVDWTFAGNTLTLETSKVSIPQSGQTLWCLMETLFYA